MQPASSQLCWHLYQSRLLLTLVLGLGVSAFRGESRAKGVGLILSSFYALAPLHNFLLACTLPRLQSLGEVGRPDKQVVVLSDF